MGIIKSIKDKLVYILGGIAIILAVLLNVLRKKNIELETEASNNDLKVKDATLAEQQKNVDQKIEEAKHKKSEDDDKSAEEYWKKK